MDSGGGLALLSSAFLGTAVVLANVGLRLPAPEVEPRRTMLFSPA